ncbi:MAG: GNAT family protein [Ketobacteraceae bacterium]|nr:GNAT family protein [Ketobacteraceae bacterium]
MGFFVNDWQGAPLPPRDILVGQYCRLEPLSLQGHGAHLHAAFQLDGSGKLWDYLPYGPFANESDYLAWIEQECLGNNPLFYAIIDPQEQKPVGVASFLRINPTHGSVEVGHLCFSPLLQGTTAATEAMFLMMQQAFDLGYRRYEWKCNALNLASRRAAQRLGFSYEGLFRQSHVFKGRNRDTAWYSVLDREWPTLRQAFASWLAPDNFESGVQKVSLSGLTAPLLAERDPALVQA